VAQHLERARPQIIEVGSPFLVPHLVRRALPSQPRPVVIGFYHSDLIRTYAEPYAPLSALAPVRVVARNLARFFIRSVYRRFDATIAASASVVAELRGLGIPNVHCVPLGVDLALFRPDANACADLRAQLGVAPDRRVALFVGRFTREKRLDVLLQAQRLLAPQERPHLVLVGQGEQRSWLETWSRTYGDLSVLPFVNSRVQLARVYRGADFYIAPGPGETFGLAIAEAMACGLPVVAVERGAAPDRIAGADCSRLYEHGSAESCARALLEMTRATNTAMRARARRHAERNFHWNHTFDRLLQVYHKVLEARAAWSARG
jgi:alpha-1,6-mannosyltransferase